MSSLFQRVALFPFSNNSVSTSSTGDDFSPSRSGQAVLEREPSRGHHNRLAAVATVEAPPPQAHIDVAGTCQPAHGVGGDFYDILDVRGNLTFAVGDISGKDWGASVLMAFVRARLRVHLRALRDLADVVAMVNRDLAAESRDHEFATLFVGTIDPHLLRLTFCSAGQSGLLVRGIEGTCTQLNTAGMALGIDPDEAYHAARIDLCRRDLVAAFTDGVLDARDGRGVMFGEVRARAALVRGRRHTARRICDDLLADIKGFRGEHPLTDDTTLAVIKVA